MITTKAIEKTRFFTTNGSDIWKVKKIDQITAVELVNCDTQQTGTCVIGEAEAKKFHPVRMPKIRVQKAEVKRQKTKREKEKTKAKLNGRVCKAGTIKSSQHLGVTVKKNKKGKKRFYAQCSRGGKWKNLGSHTVEEDAAAAVQEHLGNKEEAARLRKLAEAKTGEKIKEVKGVTAWDCVNCGKGYPYKPDKCGKCGGSSFTPAKPEVT